jgi:hypothetical protein
MTTRYQEMHMQSQKKSGNEGAFADQTAQGPSDHSEGSENPDQGDEPLGGDDGDKGNDKAGSPSRQGKLPGAE